MDNKAVAVYLTYDHPDLDSITLEAKNIMVISEEDYNKYLKDIYGFPELIEISEEELYIETKDTIGETLYIVVDVKYQDAGAIDEDGYITMDSDLAIMLINILVDKGYDSRIATCFTDLLTRLCKLSLGDYL